jgi:hypothetical protein
VARLFRKIGTKKNLFVFSHNFTLLSVKLDELIMVKARHLAGRLITV